MTLLQFNPSTQKVLFNPDTQKVLMVKADCEHCNFYDLVTPQQIKITFEGILCCMGFDCCENQTDEALTDYGIGWNQSFILEQGRLSCADGEPGTWWLDDPRHKLPCWYGAVYYGDFGGYDTYNLPDCQGGIAGHSNLYVALPTVLIASHYDGKIQFQVALRWHTSGHEALCPQPFLKVSEFTPVADCLPYDVVLNNEHLCAGDHPWPCYGNGTAIITKWPPP